MELEELSQCRCDVARELQLLLPFVQGKYHDDNANLLNNLAASEPPIEDNSWGEMTFVAGIWGRFMWKQPLDVNQRQAMWRALLWSTWYERYLRPKMLSQRFKELLSFLDGCAADLEFVNQAVRDIEPLVPDLKLAGLRQLQRMLSSRCSSSTQATDLREKVDGLVASMEATSPATIERLSVRNENEQACSAIGNLWSMLDKKLEKENQDAFDKARRDLDAPEAARYLAPLAGIISRNAVYRYCHDESLSDEQLEDAIFLANYSSLHSVGIYINVAQQSLLLLMALRDMRSSSLDPEAFAIELDKIDDERELKSAWSSLIAVVLHYLVERRRAGLIDPIQAEAWIRTFAKHVDLLSYSARQHLLAEVHLHNVPDSMALEILRGKPARGLAPQEPEMERRPLEFLGPEQQEELQESIRKGQLEKTKQILRGVQGPLLSTLSRVLADPSFNEMLPPRQPFRISIRKSAQDRFPEAKELILSPNQSDWENAVPIFEEGLRQTTHPEFVPIARQWTLFARAKAYGPVTVAADWEDDRRKQTASFEEIWNLAVFYMQNDRPERALEVLRPSLEKLVAPFSHLKFALYCAVQVLEQLSGQPDESASQDVVIHFLVDSLPAFPVPESYLMWLLLTDEVQPGADLIRQAQMLAIYQHISRSPISIPNPSEEIDSGTAEAFREQLQDLRLENTWRLWVNDYAERHPFYYKAWEWLSEAAERGNDLDAAEEALMKMSKTQYGVYRRKRRKTGAPANPAYLRSSLCNLFKFYRRNALAQKGQNTFKVFYPMVPELWNPTDLANSTLINLTRSYMGGVTPLPPEGRDLGRIWGNLHVELSKVDNVERLESLRERLETAISLTVDSIPMGHRVARERAAYIENLLREICGLPKVQWRHEELRKEIDRINKAIHGTRSFVEDEAELKPLKALTAAFSRVFESFAKMLEIQPVPVIDEHPLGAGLPDDVSETSLVVTIRNPGPGEVMDVDATCVDSEAIVSRGRASLNRLLEGDQDVMAIPVAIHESSVTPTLQCQVLLRYHWGVIRDLTCQQTLQADRFSFQSLLRDHNISGYEFPNPYVFDRAIDVDFENDDPRLFQGRETELKLIRSTFLESRFPGTPLYFYGIRKVGKTSLLNRVVRELRQGSFYPVVVNLLSIDAKTQSLEKIVELLTTRILDDAKRYGLNVDRISPISVSHPNPLAVLEDFLHAVCQQATGGCLVLLLDEFQNMVGDHTTPLLDLLRHAYQQKAVYLILSGWMHPELMRRLCPRTQLFPLVHRPVSFLGKEIVSQVLREPTKDFGIEIPDSTVDSLYLQTGGNPYLVSKSAWYGIARLNAEHRNVLAPQDIDSIARAMAEDPSNFSCSSFSALILESQEQAAAIRFAKTLQEGEDSISTSQALAIFGADTLQTLEEKHVLELHEGGLAVKGRMLATYLRNRLEESGEVPPPPLGVTKRVGLFVDIENLWPHVPSGISIKAVGETLVRYASTFGDVRYCRWAVADQRNLTDQVAMRLGLEEAGINVSYLPAERLRFEKKGNEADFLLLERITEERSHSQPEVFVLVAGDKDYYNRICSLLEYGFTVRLVASTKVSHLAGIYEELVTEREKLRFAEGYTESDFFVDDLDDVLKAALRDLE